MSIALWLHSKICLVRKLVNLTNNGGGSEKEIYIKVRFAMGATAMGTKFKVACGTLEK